MARHKRYQLTRAAQQLTMARAAMTVSLVVAIIGREIRLEEAVRAAGGDTWWRDGESRGEQGAVRQWRANCEWLWRLV